MGIVGSFGSSAEVVQMAADAENYGWDGFFTWDAISLGLAPIWDPWAILAAAAVRTQKITLGALVFALPRRRPWEVARQVLTVDHLSNGRLVLPVGVGVLDDAAFTAVPGQLTGLRERAELLDDALAFLARSWSGQPFSFDGTHVHTGEMRFETPPVRGSVPVWPVGAWPSERSMGRAAAWNGVVMQLRGERTMETPGPADVAALVDWIRERRAGRADPFDVVIQGELPGDRAAAADLLASLEAAGVTWWIESRWEPATTTADSLVDQIRRGPVRPTGDR